jgi:hypothetical protein
MKKKRVTVSVDQQFIDDLNNHIHYLEKVIVYEKSQLSNQIIELTSIIESLNKENDGGLYVYSKPLFFLLFLIISGLIYYSLKRNGDIIESTRLLGDQTTENTNQLINLTEKTVTKLHALNASNQKLINSCTEICNAETIAAINAFTNNTSLINEGDLKIKAASILLLIKGLPAIESNINQVIEGINILNLNTTSNTKSICSLIEQLNNKLNSLNLLHAQLLELKQSFLNESLNQVTVSEDVEK